MLMIDYVSLEDEKELELEKLATIEHLSEVLAQDLLKAGGMVEDSTLG